MKLTIPTALLSLFSALTHATVNITDVPSRLKVEQEVVLRWSSDRDYVRTICLAPIYSRKLNPILLDLRKEPKRTNEMTD